MKAWTLDPETAVVISAGTESYEHAVSRALESQNAIGWEHTFRGFLSLEWGHIYYTAEDITPPEVQRTRSVSLVSMYIKAFQVGCHCLAFLPEVLPVQQQSMD
jgi:hypothetical protein